MKASLPKRHSFRSLFRQNPSSGVPGPCRGEEQEVYILCLKQRERDSEEKHGGGVGDGDSDDRELVTNRAKFNGNVARQHEREQFGSKVKWIFLENWEHGTI